MAVLIAILALAALAAALGFGLAGYSMRIRGQTLTQARAWQEARYDFSWYDGLEKSDYTVASYDGYLLHAQLLKNPMPGDRYVIISHGYTDNRFGAMKYAGLYLKLGFNVIVYDLRGHGENAPTFCTYSVREGRDLSCMIDDARSRFAPRVLGLHGESLGAASTAAAMRYRPAVDFAVADCGFSEIASVFRSGLRRMRLPAGLVRLGGLCARLRYGYDYSQMRPIDALAGNRVPMLFIHGADDAFIPPWHSRRMADATSGYSEVRIIPGARHAASVLTDPDAYAACVKAFLGKVPVDG